VGDAVTCKCSYPDIITPLETHRDRLQKSLILVLMNITISGKFEINGSHRPFDHK
jgi:hypothetical protein